MNKLFAILKQRCKKESEMRKDEKDFISLMQKYEK
jgi:hypothetical protein